MSKIVITGGSGFLGSYIADTLADRGHEVVIFDRVESPHQRPGQRMILGDILDPTALAKAMTGARYVFHLAALADLNSALTRPFETSRTNILGTVQVLDAARHAGIERIFFASTVYVYSRTGGFYRCSKQACEAYVEEFERQFGLPFTILRYGSLYGPRSDETNGVYRLLKSAVRDGVVKPVGHPDDSREYIHVEDAARLTADTMQEEFKNERVVVTGAHPLRLRDLFTMFGEVLGREVTVEYEKPEGGTHDAHYRVTPYAYSPKVGRKLTSNYYVDMGQGILQMLDSIEKPERLEKPAVESKTVTFPRRV